MGHPVRLTAVGFVLLIIGTLLPFAMIADLIASTLFLNLASAFAQASGIVVGFVGMTTYRRSHR